ncbi:hypothetical protein QH494_26240 [Sphingomonas sp. AR_OL41]|uniref:hypothetical protein n=1 Tax=Sphingomonas sp. AR_OL41 TaxID=3042729 RepID=UPI002480CB07|nr:hypothetical protein [Sphingomonas sp. AR_OL41]MDH7975701.1 hypothetical protein [Sphingomonas sp. AR_OL41]
MAINIPTFVASVLTSGGGAAAIAYALFKAFGAKWMENRFAAQLEKSKQAHATETEHLRFKIASLLDRATKLNQREFEVLPDIWAKADEAYNHAAALISPWRNRPDFLNMTEPHFENLIVQYDLQQYQIDQIRALKPSERGHKFNEAMFWVELYRAQLAAHEFVKALSTGSIYVHPHTFAKLAEFANQLSKGVRTYELNHQYPTREREDDDAEAFRMNGRVWFEELGKFLRERYWGNNATALLAQPEER